MLEIASLPPFWGFTHKRGQKVYFDAFCHQLFCKRYFFEKCILMYLYLDRYYLENLLIRVGLESKKVAKC